MMRAMKPFLHTHLPAPVDLDICSASENARDAHTELGRVSPFAPLLCADVFLPAALHLMKLIFFIRRMPRDGRLFKEIILARQVAAVVPY